MSLSTSNVLDLVREGRTASDTVDRAFRRHPIAFLAVVNRLRRNEGNRPALTPDEIVMWLEVIAVLIDVVLPLVKAIVEAVCDALANGITPESFGPAAVEGIA